jgi:hypothetical protein
LPVPIVDLTDMPNLFEASNGFPHYRDFLRSIADVLDCDGGCVARANDTFIIFDGYPDPAFVKNLPIPFYEVINPGLEGIVEMGEIQLLAKAFTVKSIVESKVESGVDLVERQSWVPQFSKDGTTVNIMK